MFQEVQIVFWGSADVLPMYAPKIVSIWNIKWSTVWKHARMWVLYRELRSTLHDPSLGWWQWQSSQLYLPLLTSILTPYYPYSHSKQLIQFSLKYLVSLTASENNLAYVTMMKAQSWKWHLHFCRLSQFVTPLVRVGKCNGGCIVPVMFIYHRTKFSA